MAKKRQRQRQLSRSHTLSHSLNFNGEYVFICVRGEYGARIAFVYVCVSVYARVREL